MVEPCYIQPWLTMVNHAFEKWHATVNHGQEQPKVTMVNHGQNLHIWPWLTMVKHDHINHGWPCFWKMAPLLTMVKHAEFWPWLTMVTLDCFLTMVDRGVPFFKNMANHGLTMVKTHGWTMVNHGLTMLFSHRRFSLPICRASPTAAACRIL